MPGITILGLGPGDASQLTRQAWEVLTSTDEIWLRTTHHPSVEFIPESVTISSFDDLYKTLPDFEEVYSTIVEQILTLGKRPQGVIYAVPGHPFVAEITGPEIARRAKKEGIPLKVVEGISFLEPTFTALGLDPFPRLTLLDALEAGRNLTLQAPPDSGLLIAQIYSQFVAGELKQMLLSIFPDEHPVRMVHAAGTDQQKVEELHLFEIDRSEHVGLMTVLYVPPLERNTSFEHFLEIVARLRAPDGCPWDREQTPLSLRKHLLEETYEALLAIDLQDPMKMREEFGDLLLQIVLQAQIASETGDFSMRDVVKGISDKIIRRHPHVFGDSKVDKVEDVLENWEKLKGQEREANGEGDKSILDGVPIILPALTLAQEIQDRAARVGFDWPEIDGVVEKIKEEIDEMVDAQNVEELSSELGDLLFSVVNLARWKNVDAESVLRESSQRFKQRFKYIERQSRSSGRNLKDMTLDELELLWQESKRQIG